MKKKICSLMLIFSIIAVFIPSVPASAGNINIGEYITFGRYLDEPILWRCVYIDENGPLILSDKIIAVKPFDAKGAKTEGSNGQSSHGRGYYYGVQRRDYGSNYWGDSNIHSWLNSSAQAGYVDWECGNPPTQSEYAKEAGFLANFTSTELKSIKSVKQKSLLDGYEHSAANIDKNYHKFNNTIDNVMQNYDEAYSEELDDLIFLPDIKQIYMVYKNFNDYYIGKLTEKAAESLNPQNPSPASTLFKDGDGYHSWLRSPRASSESDLKYSIKVRYVNYKDGKVKADLAYSKMGIRPAFYLNTDSTVFASGNGTENNPYVIAMGEDDSPIHQPIPTETPTEAPTDNPTQSPTAAPEETPTQSPDNPSTQSPANTPSAGNSSPIPTNPPNTPIPTVDINLPNPTLTPSGNKSISPIGKYTDKINIDMQVTDNQILFTITSSDISYLSDIKLFNASYDSQGNLTSVDIGENLLFGNKLMILMNIYSAGTYKLMLMDNELIPLMKPENINSVITIKP